jgi:nucleoside-diphosphate-sugar epimerase
MLDLGTAATLSIKEACMLIKKLTSSKSVFNFGAVTYRKGEIMESKADISLNKKIKWRAKIKFEDGIKKLLNIMR